MTNMVASSLQFCNLGVAHCSLSHRILMNFLHAWREAASDLQELTVEKKRLRNSEGQEVNMNDFTGWVQRHKQTK